jgi:hypothetical protein
VDEYDLLFELTTTAVLGRFRLDGDVHEIRPIPVGKLAAIGAFAEGTNTDGMVTSTQIDAAIALVSASVPTLAKATLREMDHKVFDRVFRAVNDALEAHRVGEEVERLERPLSAGA